MNGFLRYGLATGVMLGLGLASLSGGTLPPVAGPVAVAARPLVLVADGAGGYGGCSSAMARANLLAGAPAEVRVFQWSHGYGRIIIDQVDLGHAREQGQRLATVIAEQRACEPDRRIILVSHSAGAAVVLAAGEASPPGSIDRMILLAPSVSRGYDLRPSLCAAREGIDVFCSKKDWLMLGIGARLVGTTDRYLGLAAGRHGFRTDNCDTCSVRHHFWSPEMAWSGNTGGHFGTHSPKFMQAYLLPLISPQPPGTIVK